MTPVATFVRLLLLSVLVMSTTSSAGQAGTTWLLPDAGEPQREPGGLAVSRFFEDKTRSLPPTHPAFALDFPLDLAERMLWDTGYILTSPGRWQSEQWMEFSVVAAGTGGMFALDRTIDIESRIRHPRSSGEGHFEDGIENAGDLWGIVAVVGGSELFGFLSANEEAKQIGVDAGEAAGISALLTASLKEVTGRERPDRGNGPLRFRPLSGNASFPSGHATAAFSLAAAVSEHFEDNWLVAVPAYGIAGLVALARTRANDHFASDVFLGAAIGTSTAKTVVDLEKGRLREEQKKNGPRVSVSPLFIGGLPGVGMNLRF